MSAFQSAATDFLRLQQAEEAIAAASPEGADLDDNPEWVAAIDATQHAFDRLFALPAENLLQASAKLAALSSFYIVPGCGCDPQDWATLVAEVVRFAAVDALRGAA